MFNIFNLFSNASSVDDALLAALNAGALIVDVRTAAEFSMGSVPKAINIPLDKIGAKAQELISKNKPVIVFCRSGARSQQAAQILKNAGLEKVFNVGGLSDMKAILQSVKA